MASRIAWLVAGASLLSPAVAAAEDAAVQGELPGYCRYVNGVADAETALKVAPQLYSEFGVINSGTATGSTTPLGEPEWRLVVGVRWDVIDLLEGLKLQDRADAQCRRWRAENAMEVAIRAGDVGAAPALAAKARVLAEALPEAERLVKGLDEDVQLARATRDQLDAVRVRLDGLRSEVRQVFLEQQKMEGMPHGQGDSMASVIAAYRAADDRIEETEGSIRSLHMWDVEVRGGYDEIFQVEQGTPLFALLTVSFNFGGFWVSGANEDARAGRRAWVAEAAGGVDRRISDLVEHLGAVRASEKARLQEVSVLQSDLEGQLQQVSTLGTSRVRNYETFLFFEVTRLRAERAYLESHLAELDRIIGAASR